MKGLTTIQEHVAVLRGRDENLQGQQELLEAEKSAGAASTKLRPMVDNERQSKKESLEAVD